MCDYFWQRMVEKSQGDLTDIFRSSGPATPAEISTTITDCCQLPPDPVTAFPPLTGCFFDNFADVKDPLLHELAGTGFFGSPEKTAASNSLSSMLHQISPLTSNKAAQVILQPSPAKKIGGGVAQISSPRTPAIKRRKSQARKVVCIPAPAMASGRPGTGEVVPSDLWAWRKYGQKPIKGSPYPRGYYRCSSSKGCSARKQVERSRTDPNMLVVTYTSDHNHPWPTQRNALAGSTRTQSSKTNNASATSKSSSINQMLPVEDIIREEAKESLISSSIPLVKEPKEMENTVVKPQHDDFDQLFHKSFNEIGPDDHFFADLAELDADPMSLALPKVFIGDNVVEKNNNKVMDPFSMFGWGGGNSFAVTKRS